jgi:hypothetical protein
VRVGDPTEPNRVCPVMTVEVMCAYGESVAGRNMLGFTCTAIAELAGATICDSGYWERSPLTFAAQALGLAFQSRQHCGMLEAHNQDRIPMQDL